MDTRRMPCCGQPACDHIPLRYPLRVAVRHLLIKLTRFGR